jgi:hypothetical protein
MEVVVEDKQLSLAIGKKGQNVRLAAKLTGWRIDIKSEEEKRRKLKRSSARSNLAKARLPRTPQPTRRAQRWTSLRAPRASLLRLQKTAKPQQLRMFRVRRRPIVATVRIYKVAELLGTTSQEVLALLKRDHGIELKSASSTVEEVVARSFVERVARQRQHLAPRRRHVCRHASAAEGWWQEGCTRRQES